MSDDTTPLITARDAVLRAALAKIGGPPNPDRVPLVNEPLHNRRPLLPMEHGDRKWFGVTYHWHHNGTRLQLHRGSFKDCEEDS